MEFHRSYGPRLKKNILSTRRKMKVLSALSSDSRSRLCDNDSEVTQMKYESISDHAKGIMALLQSEQSYVECLSQLKECLLHPELRGDIETLSDIIGLVDEMLSTHSNLYKVLLCGKPDFSGALEQLSSFMDVYVSYSIFISFELSNFQKFSELHGKNGMHIIELIDEPMTHISRYKTLFQNLYTAQPEEIYCDILNAIENTGEKIKNASYVRKNAVRTLQIQRLLFRRQPKILSPGRTVLKQGILFKVKDQGRGLKKRVFFLFSDIFLCCKILSDTFDWHENDSLLFSTLFPLDKCSVNFVMGSSASNGALFKVTCGTLSYLLISKIPGESQSWVQELQTAIKVCQKPSSGQKTKLNRGKNICLRQRMSPFCKNPARSIENVCRGEENRKVESMNVSECQPRPSSLRKVIKIFTCIKM